MSGNPNDKLSGIPFGEALQRFTQTDPKEVAIVMNATMRDEEIELACCRFRGHAVKPIPPSARTQQG